MNVFTLTDLMVENKQLQREAEGLTAERDARIALITSEYAARLEALEQRMDRNRQTARTLIQKETSND